MKQDKNQNSKNITSATTAQYFSKNLQQIGFSSLSKAVLTSVKELIDNSLDASEEHGILPEIRLEIKKLGPGTMKGSDLLQIIESDNGPGIDPENVPKVFGEYLASSKFGRGRCSRGVQGIGAAAVTSWAQTTSLEGAKVITKTKKMKKAYSCSVEVDLKHNKGLVKNEKQLDVDFAHGTQVEFKIDGKTQINGEAGIMSYINGVILVNPSLTIHYKILDDNWVTVERVSKEPNLIPEAVLPHPHTMNLGEFIQHSGVFSGMKTRNWLKESFSRFTEANISELVKKGITKKLLDKTVDSLNNDEKKELYTKVMDLNLQAPSTKSVRQIGEENLAKSIQRLGEVDFFSVITRKPTIVDFKPVQIEVAIARLKNKSGEMIVKFKYSDLPI